VTDEELERFREQDRRLELAAKMIEDLKAEIARLKGKAPKRDRAAYMREYRQRKKQ